MFLNTHNLIHNNKVIIYRYIIHRGEVIVTFNLSFIRFNLVLDFKYLNCYGVQINNYIQNSTIEKWSDFNSVRLRRAAVTPLAPRLYSDMIQPKP